ncbi:Transcriptional regulatory protein DegU [compost metagenome]
MTPATRSSASLLEGARILIVDDEPDMLAILREWFACFGGHTQTAADGFEAVRQLKAQPYDLVITDLMMPGLNGLQLLGIIKELDSTVEVIILTGEGTMEDAVIALRGGNAYDFLQKPLRSLAQLNESIVMALGRRRRAQAMARLLGGDGPAERPGHIEALSPRESQILALVVAGHDNREIGEQLHISEKTVKNHLTRVFEKLKVKNRVQAIAACCQYRLV